MTMRKEVREWWLELADQYEEWADSPPRYNMGEERYTCVALIGSRFGWYGWDAAPCVDLMPVWYEQYGDVEYPAGFWSAVDRPEKREAFCLYMAERIREEVGHE
jgi:hypothetical protein